MPGGRLRNGRGASLGLRYGVLAGSTLIAAGLIGVTAYGMGRASVPDVPAEVDDAVTQYGLTTFDTESAEAYAEDFLRSCLLRHKQTPGKPSPEEEARIKRVETMSVAESDAACETADTADDVQVERIRSVGKPQPVEGVDNARYITVQARTTEPSTARYTVPVSLDDPETGVGARVVGPVGVLPVPKNGEPDTSSFPAPAEDVNLAREWEQSFIPEVMQAWVASDDLSQYLVSDATAAASSGLRGEYEDVNVESVSVIPPEGQSEDDDSGEFVYTEGDEVVAHVDLTMTSEGGTVTGSTFRVTLRKQGDHWFLTDVEGGGLGTGEPE